MRKTPRYLIAIAAFLSSFYLIFLISCQKDFDGPGQAEPPSIDQEKVTASMRGIVVDEHNVPVVGASVTSADKSTTTDRFGVFTFKNISLSKNNGFVKV